MSFKPTLLQGVILIEPGIFRDSRGIFYESYNAKEFSRHGIHARFLQDNHSISKKGTLRALHFQAPPKAQAKLVRVVRGKAFDAVVDVRKGSKTFGWYTTCTLSAENKKMLYIPEGFAHGFLALEEQTEFLYKVSDYYSPSHERGIIWDDPAIGIPWPKVDTGYFLSDKDKKNPPLGEVRF